MLQYKKVFLMLILFLITNTGNLNNIDSQSTNKLPYEFKLVCTGYYKRTKLPNGKWSERQFIKTDKEHVLINFTKQSLSLYEVESVSNDKEWYTRPKLDKNGNPIPLKITKNNPNDAINILNGSLEIKVTGEAPNTIFIGFIQKKDKFSGLARLLSKGYEKEVALYPISQYMIKNNDQIDSNLTFIFTDTSMDYQVRKVNDKGTFEVSFQKSINPDIDDVGKYIGIREMVDYAYLLANEDGKGFLAITPNKSQFLSNGKVSEIGYVPQIVNGKLFVYAQWFVNQVYGYTDYKADTKEIIIKRLYQRIGGEIKLIDISLVEDEDVVTMNGKKYKLSAKPIFDPSYIMIPLRDLCELLKVRLIYQPISNTYLIQRFNSAYDPPFNLKEVNQ